MPMEEATEQQTREILEMEEPEAAEVKTEAPQTDSDTSVSEPKEETETQEPEMTEEQRRSWQSERDRALNELKLERERAEAMQKQIQFLQAQNQQVLQTVQPLLNLSRPAEEKEDVQFTDEYGNIIPEKFQQFLDVRDQSRESEITKRVRESLKREEEERKILDQAEELCQEHPEYRDVYGKPDLVKIKNAIEKRSAELGLKGILFGTPARQDAIVNKIKENASKSASVVQTQGSDDAPKISENAKIITSYFGEYEPMPD